ncbi:hypothetical protein GCM10027169_08290 [Gordonia jinhuaensis]|uniref:ABC-2 family transporter protein n=1 Tax=Gordonia jinhuaensis TaxID=1517702 RepID=A0A916TG68_9ACTN|nr:hypothetical protein [Gordonia jinhuaensis]GGB41884.1 hypothetical protein GCM10011489_31800 [Gordonia jinhuaensis]
MSHVTPQAVPMRTILTHVVVPALMGVAMALCYIGGFSKPDPHHLRIDIVGPAPQAAVATSQLQNALGDRVDLRTSDSAENATEAIQHRDLVAAYVLSPTKPQLLVSTGASDTQAVTVERMFTPVANQANLPLEIRDVAPVDSSSDPSGQSLFFYMVALTVGGYGTAIAIGVAAGSRRMRVRIGLGVGGAAVVTFLVMLIASAVFDAIPSHVWEISLLSFVYLLAVMAFGISLHVLLGRFTTLAMVTIFVGLNFTTCGGVFPPSLQPGFFSALHSFWLGAGLNEAGRNLMYFPDVSIVTDVWKIVGWVLVGGALLAIATYVQKRRLTPTPTPPRDQLDPESEEELEEDVAA